MPILPISVRTPVDLTWAMPWPLTTIVPENFGFINSLSPLPVIRSVGFFRYKELISAGSRPSIRWPAGTPGDIQPGYNEPKFSQGFLDDIVHELKYKTQLVFDFAF